MSQLLINPSTNRLLQRAIDNPPHAILLSGRAGSGKTRLINYLSACLLDISEERLSSYAYHTTVDTDDKVITIEQIRSLQNFLKLKVPSAKDNNIKRIACIILAERMRTEAQNALLKTLEEPPAGTVIILTANHPTKLLPTIISRVQTIEVLPIDELTAKKYYPDLPADEFRRAYALSGGQTGLLQALLNSQYHPLIEYIEQAKQILAKSAGQRLYEVDELAKDREASYRLLDALLRITRAGIQAASHKQDIQSVSAWYKRQKAIVKAIDNLQTNTQVKLVLDNLFLSI